MQEIETRQIKVGKVQHNQFGRELVISMISQYINGKYVKHLPLTPELLETLKNKNILISNQNKNDIDTTEDQKAIR